jgi:hypothetical protein
MIERLDDVDLLPCPFCGFSLDPNDADCIYPVGKRRNLWALHCYETGGGCGAEVLGNSVEDVINKWNSRYGPS